MPAICGSHRGLVALAFLATPGCARTAAPTRAAVRAPVAASAGGRAQARSYVVLARPFWEVGARVHVVADSVQQMNDVWRADGQAPEPHDSRMATHLEADRVVEAVDARGRIESEDFAIVAFTLSMDDHRMELLHAGQHVWIDLGEHRGESAIVADGRPVSPVVRTALGRVLPLSKSDLPIDQAFGTLERQVVGAYWPIDRPGVERTLEAIGFFVPFERVEGQAQLVGIESLDGVPCLDVRADVQLGPPPFERVQPGDLLQHHAARLRVRDLSSVSAEDHVEQTELILEDDTAMRATMPQGGPGLMESHHHTTRTVALSPAR